MKLFNNIGAFVLGLCYFAYSGQIQFLFFICFLYLFFHFLVRKLCKKQSIVVEMTDFFFLIYGILILLSHIELINDPQEDFYVHNDAARSFYSSYIDVVLPCKWSDLWSNTFGNLYFFHYPLSAFIMCAFGQLGLDIGIENLRLFLRLESLIFGVLIIAIISKCLKDNKLRDSEIRKYVLFFGFFSFLFISSAIFSRDIHVTLVYTLGAFYTLHNHAKSRLLIFAVLFLFALGARPQSGVVFLLYPAICYYKELKKKIGILGFFVLGIILLGLFFIIEDFLSFGIETLDEFDEMAEEESDGLFIKLYRLPFPINTMIMSVYSYFQPIPFGRYIFQEGGTWLNITSIFTPYLYAMIGIICAYYLFHNKDYKNPIFRLILVSFIIYLIIVFGSPDNRRTFAVMPGLFMCFCLIYKDSPLSIKRKSKYVYIPLLLVVNALIGIYVYTR